MNALTKQDGYVKLDKDEIQRMYESFDSDSNVLTLFNRCMDTLLNGEILIGRADRKMTPPAKAWHHATWSEWLRKFFRSFWCLGFAAITYVSDAMFGARPMVLDLTSVDVYVMHTIYDESVFRYFLPSGGHASVLETLYMTHGTISTSSQFNYQHELQNVFTRCSKSPTRTGRLCSFMRAIADDYAHEVHKLRCDAIADHRRCDPPLISEHVEAKYNPNNLSSAYSLAKPGSGGADGSPSDGNTDNMQAQYERRGFNPVQKILNMFHSQKPTLHGDMLQHMQKWIDGTQQGAYANQIWLPPGRTVAASPSVEGPDNLLEWRLSRFERIGYLVGYPVALLTGGASSIGGNALSKGGGDNDRLVMYENQREMKIIAKNSIQFLYHVMFSKQHLAEVVAERFQLYAKRRRLEAGTESQPTPNSSSIYHVNSERQTDPLIKQYIPSQRALTDGKTLVPPEQRLQERRKRRRHAESEEGCCVDPEIEERRAAYERGSQQQKEAHDPTRPDDLVRQLMLEHEAQEDAEALAAAIDITVEITSIPEATIVETLYFTGRLEYEWMKQSYSSRYGIPLEAFPPVALVPLRELDAEGNVQPPPAPPKPKTSTAK